MIRACFRKITIVTLILVMIFFIGNIYALGDVPDISAGTLHSCGIKIDGTIICWGDNTYGESSPPPGEFMQVSIGNIHTCGLRVDGTVICWGANYWGQANNPIGTFKQISSGYYHTCGILQDDTVTCWGYNTKGQSNAPSGTFKQISAGMYNTCGIKMDDTVLCWGDNSVGQSNAPSGTFKQISVGNFNTCAINYNNSLICWGGGFDTPVPIGTFVQISLGYLHACGIKTNGDSICWGWNYYGQINNPADSFSEISAGNSNTCGLKTNGNVICWGWNNFGHSSPPSGLIFKTLDLPVSVVPEPTNLSQQIQSPYFVRENVSSGEKIGKFQSGSGIILSANVNTIESSRLIANVYIVGNDNPEEFYGEYSTDLNKELTIPYLGAGDYYWKLRVETVDGKLSDWVNFGTDNPYEVDYTLYEGFEPYPYGYKFANNTPANGVLNGGIDNSFWTGERSKIDGNRWDIFNKAFPEYSFKNTNQMFDVFEIMGMQDNVPFKSGNCFGMSLSAAMLYEQPFYMNERFYDFYLQVYTGSIWNNIEPIKTSYLTNRWDEYNIALKTILTLQLYQFSSSYQNAENNSLNTLTATGILEKIRNNPGKPYILSLYGEVNGNMVAHAVVPYKVEGDKIYIWDNNVQFPQNKYGKSYEQFIQINSDGSWANPNSELYKWKFTKLSLVETKDIDHSTLGLPDGFNQNDTLIAASGNSDVYITDSSGKITGFKDGIIYEEIPGAHVVARSSNTLSGTIENTWKQIYIPQKTEGLTIKVAGKNEEKYNLMIAGGDYYTKMGGVNTNTGQIDNYNVVGTGVTIDFDNQKAGSYSLLTDNFQDNLTGTVYLSGIITTPEPQKFSYDWSAVLRNSSDAISYQVDSDNNGEYDTSSNFSAVPKSINEKASISGYVKGDTNARMAGWKICIDKNKNGTCEENSEIFTTTDNKGYYRFGNLEKGNYTIIEIPHHNWSMTKPLNKKYDLILNSGQNLKDLNFENVFLKGKNK